MSVLISYIRDENGVPFGCVVALSKTQYGVSLCNKKDVFHKNIGREMAIGRAMCNQNHSFHMPAGLSSETRKRQAAVMQALQKMHNRAERYYK